MELPLKARKMVYVVIRRLWALSKFHVWAALALIILIVGGGKFFTAQVRYPNEPMSSICR
jgi:hypothetical protein